MKGTTPARPRTFGVVGTSASQPLGADCDGLAASAWVAKLALCGHAPCQRAPLTGRSARKALTSPGARCSRLLSSASKACTGHVTISCGIYAAQTHVQQGLGRQTHRPLRAGQRSGEGPQHRGDGFEASEPRD